MQVAELDRVEGSYEGGVGGVEWLRASFPWGLGDRGSVGIVRESAPGLRLHFQASTLTNPG